MRRSGDQSGASNSPGSAASPLVNPRLPRETYATLVALSHRGNTFSPPPVVIVSRVPDVTSTETIWVVPAPRMRPPPQTCSGSPVQNASRVPSPDQCGVPAVSLGAVTRRRPEPSG